MCEANANMIIKVHDVISYCIILFIWLGLFSYFVSSTLGGAIYWFFLFYGIGLCFPEDISEWKE